MNQTTHRAVIVDDETLARDGIRIRLERLPDFEVAGEFDSGEAALAGIENLEPDVVFLDIEMPGLGGIDLAARFGPEELPVLVFVTAHDRYAVQAFGVRALDYLLKPYDDERFFAMLDRVRARIAEVRDGALGRHVRHALAAELGRRPVPAVARIPVPTRSGTIFVPVDSIDWIEAARDYVRLHVGAKSHLVRKTLSGMAGELDPTRFLRIHRSTIVNIDRIRELQTLFRGDLVAVLESGRRLTVSRSRREELERALRARR